MRKFLMLAAAAAMIPAMAAGQGNGKAGKVAKHGQHMSKGNAAKAGKAGHSGKHGQRMSKRHAAEEAKAASGAGGHGQFCPPGLARKDNGCLPPGQAKRDPTAPPFSSREQGFNVPANYRGLYGNTRDFRYDGSGDIHRIDRRTKKVTGIIPLLGGSLSRGRTLPAGYDVYNLPQQYRSAFQDSGNANYRYGDNAIYRVDPETKMINGVAALLAKDNFNVGAALPSGYDSYNVPLQLRSQYPDTGETLHRYANGNIYQVDAKTRVIQSIIAALL